MHGSGTWILRQQIEGKGEHERIVIGTVLPVGFMFDHRLVDGVMGGRILTRLNELVQDPVATWGERC